jgi:hypothetical protein
MSDTPADAMDLTTACVLAHVIAEEAPRWIVLTIQRVSIDATGDRHAVEAWSAQTQTAQRFTTAQQWKDARRQHLTAVTASPRPRGEE